MRRTEHLIRQIRRQTDNEQIGNDDGLSTEEILQYLNEVQEDLQQAIIQGNVSAFLETALEDVVRNQEEYDVPPTTFGEQGICRVDYAFNGLSDDYRPLKHTLHVEERTYTGTAPWQWTMRRNKIMINPVPSSGQANGLRIWYREKVPGLDIRRSQVDVITVASQITALTLDPTLFDANYDEWAEDDFLTIVGSDGTVKAYGIAYTAVNPSSGLVTLDSSITHTLVSTPAVDDWVCRGFRATTHGQLADFCEKAIIEYGSFRVLSRDESDSAQRESAVYNAMKTDIINSYEELQGDIDHIPAINYDFAEYL